MLRRPGRLTTASVRTRPRPSVVILDNHRPSRTSTAACPEEARSNAPRVDQWWSSHPRKRQGPFRIPPDTTPDLRLLASGRQDVNLRPLAPQSRSSGSLLSAEVQYAQVRRLRRPPPSARIRLRSSGVAVPVAVLLPRVGRVDAWTATGVPQFDQGPARPLHATLRRGAPPPGPLQFLPAGGSIRRAKSLSGRGDTASACSPTTDIGVWVRCPCALGGRKGHEVTSAGTRRTSTRWPLAREHFADELRTSDQLHHFLRRQASVPRAVERGRLIQGHRVAVLVEGSIVDGERRAACSWASAPPSSWAHSSTPRHPPPLRSAA